MRKPYRNLATRAAPGVAIALVAIVQAARHGWEAWGMAATGFMVGAALGVLLHVPTGRLLDATASRPQVRPWHLRGLVIMSALLGIAILEALSRVSVEGPKQEVAASASQLGLVAIVVSLCIPTLSEAEDGLTRRSDPR